MPHPPANALTNLDVLTVSHLPDSWQTVLNQPDVSSQLASIQRQLAARLAQGATIFPADPWRALQLTPLERVSVVILGQDPYHGPGQAQGLAFSVGAGIQAPPSLRNIFQEIDRSQQMTLKAPRSNDLTSWCGQGVLLLNTALTVEQGAAASHARLGWQHITDRLIAAVATRQQPAAFLLWGNHAQSKQSLIEEYGDGQRHLVLLANHPSPLSARRPPRPFIGCNHFELCNQWLRAQGRSPIEW